MEEKPVHDKVGVRPLTDIDLLFQKKFHENLKRSCSASYSVKLRYCPTNGLLPKEIVEIPKIDHLHFFNGYVQRALGHTIEDLALENGEQGGELTLLLDGAKNFSNFKKRYELLSKKLDRIRIWSIDPLDELPSNIDLIHPVHPRLTKYRFYLFRNSKLEVVFVCKQLNRATEISSKKFIGFCSFDPFIVHSLRWKFYLLSSGIDKIINHWEKFFLWPTFRIQEIENFINSKLDSYFTEKS
ncbi:hypothetical protein [Methylacidiphilum caldifontis]|uniref:Uncharacterized protein n=1 Tax=Methylacidiphilum caldifontis TaxID=2795386 RepID=A0A4Y8PCL0_9BACT|nr:hypothetical protein [Methylacidiphilum caldifontis]TFE68977.1 hypothetical protein A7Q10_07705 [Methylacidiphilum caldifontis]